jgi:hypothetical protein
MRENPAARRSWGAYRLDTLLYDRQTTRKAHTFLFVWLEQVFQGLFAFAFGGADAAAVCVVPITGFTSSLLTLDD